MSRCRRDEDAPLGANPPDTTGSESCGTKEIPLGGEKLLTDRRSSPNLRLMPEATQRRANDAPARTPRRRIPSLDLVPEEILTPPVRGMSGRLDRPAAALVLDGWLRRLGRQEALCRRVLGALAARFLSSRACHSLGFARLSDWTRERLGMGARELQELARAAERLGSLPEIRDAFDRGELSWAKVRLLTRFADAESERTWIELARERPVRALEALMRDAPHPSDTADESERVSHCGAHKRDHHRDHHRDHDDDDDETCDGELRARFSVPCPRRVVASWNQAVELARRMAGEQLPVWQAAEAIAAEALTASESTRRTLGGPWVSPDDLWREQDRLDAATKATRDEARERRREAARDERHVGHECLDWTALREALPLEVERLADDCDTLDPWELDARLREVVRALQRIDWQTGRLLRIFHDLRGPELAGFGSLSSYVRERLGCSSRRARGLIAIERRSGHSPALGEAYREGRLSWVRALAILPAVRTSTGAAGAAWVERAREVTVRRLMDEVDHALERQEDAEAVWPPAPDTDLRKVGETIDEARATHGDASAEKLGGAEIDGRELDGGKLDGGKLDGGKLDGGKLDGGELDGGKLDGGKLDGGKLDTEERQMCSRRRLARWGVQDSTISFTGPESVVVLLKTAMRSFGTPYHFAWSSLERLLFHVRSEWEGRPRHRDPIFERDGWRCAVPACSSRKNLHDHHVMFRSRGGANDLGNRTTVCAWHHLRGIHEGRIRAFGRAPHEIVWEVGRTASGAPLFRSRGDRYVAASA